MKGIKIFFGVLAALWALGLILKFIRHLPFIFNGSLNVSGSLGSVAGIIIAGLISYACFNSALKKSAQPPQQP